jgi:hypothetical protein
VISPAEAKKVNGLSQAPARSQSNSQQSPAGQGERAKANGATSRAPVRSKIVISSREQVNGLLSTEAPAREPIKQVGGLRAGGKAKAKANGCRELSRGADRDLGRARSSLAQIANRSTLSQQSPARQGQSYNLASSGG